LNLSCKFQDDLVLALKRNDLIGIACAAALCALASSAGAATSLDNLPIAPIASPESGLMPETQPYRPLFPIEDDDLTSFIAHATTNAVSARETSVWVKVLLGLAGLGFLLRRQTSWRKAAYIAFNQRNRSWSQSQG
jgi:hypothetical protein